MPSQGRIIEIFENDLVTSRNSPDTIASMISDAGLRTTVYQPFRDFEGLNLRVKAFDRAERKFDLMARLDTDLLMICSSSIQLPHLNHKLQRIFMNLLK